MSNGLLDELRNDEIQESLDSLEESINDLDGEVSGLITSIDNIKSLLHDILYVIQSSNNDEDLSGKIYDIIQNINDV